MALQALATNLWIADQPQRFLGLAVGTRMTVIRLSEGRLAVISPIALTPELSTELDQLGTVTYQIAPNCYHHLYAQGFKQQYSQAEFWAAMGLQEKCPDLQIEQIFTAFQGQLDPDLHYQQVAGVNVPSLDGLDPLNEVVFYHPSSRTLIITDIAFHFDNTFAYTLTSWRGT
jgi:hypothetical protein